MNELENRKFFRSYCHQTKGYLMLCLDHGQISFKSSIDGLEGVIDFMTQNSKYNNWRQQTPLKDKNGQTLWEGDIVEMSFTNEFGSLEKRISVMKMQPDGFFGFRFDISYNINTVSPPTVIGNIDENPELVDKLPKE